MIDDDIPDACPACGGDPERRAMGWVCADCGDILSTIDTRGAGGG